MKQELTAAEQRLRQLLLRSEAVDEFAECLVSHGLCCGLREEALDILMLVGISEIDYLEGWAMVLYNA
jgi:hypothetical protein